MTPEVEHLQALIPCPTCKGTNRHSLHIECYEAIDACPPCPDCDDGINRELVITDIEDMPYVDFENRLVVIPLEDPDD